MAEENRSRTDRRFFVTATVDIGDKILAGDDILIDPDAAPAVGRLVLTDRSLEPWSGQSEIRGIAVSLQRDLA